MTSSQIEKNILEVTESLINKTICNLENNRNWHGDKGYYTLPPELVKLNLESLRDDVKKYLLQAFPVLKGAFIQMLPPEKKADISIDLDHEEYIYYLGQINGCNDCRRSLLDKLKEDE